MFRARPNVSYHEDTGHLPQSKELKGRYPLRILCEASVDTAKATPRDGNPELYYPGTEETLWEVAKRYGVSPAALALQNGLSDEAPGEPESLGGKRFLLI